mmetsp:Transcript_21734/g.74719  ORF Transcript_21734/g.74719 Transcript_21734/m.74719 type:complete len:211 (+) Transcript_21734:449-1081(+)
MHEPGPDEHDVGPRRDRPRGRAPSGGHLRAPRGPSAAAQAPGARQLDLGHGLGFVRAPATGPRPQRAGGAERLGRLQHAEHGELPLGLRQVGLRSGWFLGSLQMRGHRKDDRFFSPGCGNHHLGDGHNSAPRRSVPEELYGSPAAEDNPTAAACVQHAVGARRCGLCRRAHLQLAGRPRLGPHRRVQATGIRECYLGLGHVYHQRRRARV